MLIRYAELDDLQDIVRIYNSTIPGRMVTADTQAITVEQKTAWFYEHNRKQRPLWVMEEEGRVIAWLSFQSFYGRPAYSKTVEISIYVDEVYRSKGFGKLFLEFAIESCKNYEVNVLLGFVFGHNIPSKRLFQNYGFENWGVLPGVAVLDGVERDLIIFGRRV